MTQDALLSSMIWFRSAGGGSGLSMADATGYTYAGYLGHLNRAFWLTLVQYAACPCYTYVP